MKNDHAFADAARPTQVVCLRLPLLPYSLGHEILLLQQRNPLVSGSAQDFAKLSFDDQRKALVRAVLVCSNDWKHNQKPHKWMRIWRWMLRNVNWDMELVEFQNYLIAASAAFPGPDPEAADICAKTDGYTPQSEARGRAMGSPLISRLLHFVSRLDLESFGVECIYDFPMALANLIYETALESDGAARIENQDERDTKEEMKAHRAATAAKRAAEKEKQSGLATPPPELGGQE